jgi:excinuclease ABC subunit B
MARFEIVADMKPAGDQPAAIAKLSQSIKDNHRYQTLLGVTGSGKTFTMANIIETLQIPTLIMTHNKTLAAQLYSEFKAFFPKNHVEYFISYYDYYQPEAYIPRQDLFIEKDSAINEELERLRLSATASLLQFDDCIVVASVSANYGLGDPVEYKTQVQTIELGMNYSQREFLLKLVEMGYKRNDNFFDRGDFRVKGEAVDIYPAYFDDVAIRIEFFGDECEKIYEFDPLTNKRTKDLSSFTLYAASNYVVGHHRLANAIKQIEEELAERLDYFLKENKLVEYQRLKQRVEFDLEMMESTGMCKGIENYSRYLTGKAPGETPFSMMDYFEAIGKDYLVIVDESHVSLPQFRGMYAGDRSRKETLVEYGFRLPSALDNRPLKFDEFINKAPHYLFVSATPAALEIELSAEVATQIVRPTGLLDPVLEIHSADRQVEIFHDEAKKTIARGERVLATVLTKKMAEELTKYLNDIGLRVKYMHSDIDTVERTEIIRGLRRGEFDILVGINLLREGLDLPEVSMIGIFDADKEGFLRSETSLIQTIGRAARNLNGRVLLFANRTTESMRKAIETTNERRLRQDEYNKLHGITPKSTIRRLDESLKMEDETVSTLEMKKRNAKLPKVERDAIIKELTMRMHKAAKELEFEEAARLRDEISRLRV